jgi:hypothetical protein
MQERVRPDQRQDVVDVASKPDRDRRHQSGEFLRISGAGRCRIR